MTPEERFEPVDNRMRADTWALVGIAAIVALAHILTNGRYGFHRDELQVLSDARHLDWGFVPYPPLTPFVERTGLSIFGVSADKSESPAAFRPRTTRFPDSGARVRVRR